MTSEQLDIESENFTRLLQTAAFNNTKEIRHITKGINYPVEIRNLVKERRSGRRKWERARYPADKTVFNNKTQELKREIRKLKYETMKLFLINLTGDEETYYSLSKKWMKKPIMPIPPIRKGQGNWTRENKQKTDLFADHLAEVFTPNNIQNNNNIEEINTIITEEITHVIPK
jgi:hypothetical protein